MPRIPTRDNLQHGVPRPSGGIVSAPRDFTGPAMQETGRQLFDIARTQAMDQQAQQQHQQQRSALELVKARSRWETNLAAEQATYTPRHKPDHGNWNKTYQTRANAWQKQAAGVISDPDVRQQFIAETDDEIVQGALDIEQRARVIEMSARRTEADDALLQQVNVAASQSDQRGKITMGGVHASLQGMVEAGLISAEEAAGRSVTYARLYASRKTADLVKQDPVLAMAMLSDEEPGPAMLIRQLENFRSTPYWQAGAIRAGYGSDTVTGEDGTIEKIVPGTAVTRADADRDLLRRVNEIRNRVLDQVGRKVFERLPPAGQAALISVGYRTGILPEKVTEAVKTSDAEAIAFAIEGSADADDGTTQARTIEQAAVVRGDDDNHYERIARRPSWVGVLDPVLKSALHDTASREMERTDNQRSLADRTFARRLGGDIRSDIRSVYSSGNFPDPDPDDVLRELGEDKHRQWTDIRQDAAEVHEKTQDLPHLPGDEIARIVETTRPRSGLADFERRQAVHERISRRAHEIRLERRDHPARAAMRVASVRQALFETQDMSTSTPEKVQMLVREMRATQLALGTPKDLIAPIPDEWAIEIGKVLGNIASGPGSADADVATGDIQQLYTGMKEQYGEFADSVISYSFSNARALSRGRTRHVAALVKSPGSGP